MAVRGRLRSRCAVPLLQSVVSCGHRPQGQPAAPVWGRHFLRMEYPPPKRTSPRSAKGGHLQSRPNEGHRQSRQRGNLSPLGKTPPRSEKRRTSQRSENRERPNARQVSANLGATRVRLGATPRPAGGGAMTRREGGASATPERRNRPPPPAGGGAKAEGGASARSRREARKRSRSSASDRRVSGWRARCTRRSGADGTHGEVSGASSASDSRVSGWRARCRAANDASAASGMPEGRTDGTDGTDGNGNNGNGTNRERRNVPTIRRQNGNAGGKTRNGGGERGKVRRIRRQNGRAGGKTRNTGGGMQNTGGRTRNTGGGMQNAGGERGNVPRIEGGKGAGNIERTNIITTIIMRRAAGLRQHVRCLSCVSMQYQVRSKREARGAQPQQRK